MITWKALEYKGGTSSCGISSMIHRIPFKGMSKMMARELKRTNERKKKVKT